MLPYPIANHPLRQAEISVKYQPGWPHFSAFYLLEFRPLRSECHFTLCPFAAIPYNQRVSDLHGHAITGVTRFCAVLGYPVHHSASPVMQNAGIDALGLDWRYLAFSVTPADLRQAIAGAQAMGFIGLNLSVPHKVPALDLMDELDETARKWGAVNTVRFETLLPDGQWQASGQRMGTLPAKVRAKGFNTDAEAIIRSLREDLRLEPAGARVVLLGAGGAGRVAALRLAQAGVDALYLVNRTTEKAQAIAREIQQNFPSVRVFIGYADAPVDLVLNATSLGLQPEDALPWDESRFSLSLARSAYDMIYRPVETPFLRQARQHGCQTANGLGMLLYQGALALELWTGHPPPLAPMRRALEENIYAR
jgi:shikimate dehydrogenase